MPTPAYPPTMAIEDRLRDLLSRLKGVEPKGKNQWQALCPAHDDTRPSLGVGMVGTRTISVNCLTGCDYTAVLAAVGLTPSDLFPPREKHAYGYDSPSEPRGEIVATYDYHDAAGKLSFQVVRLDPKDFRQRQPAASGNGWEWTIKGCPTIPYRLPQILAAEHTTPIYIVEGEKDADRLAALGLIATCNTGGAAKASPKSPRPRCKWKSTHSQFLSGRTCIILPDNDQPGRDHAYGVATSLASVADVVKIVELPGLADKGDVSDWLDAGGTVEQLLSLVEAAPRWQQSSLPQPPTNGESSAPWCGFNLTDLGNAERFARQHGSDSRYCYAWNSWLVWDGARWAVDAMGDVERRAKQTVRRIYQEAADESLTQPEVKKIAEWAEQSEKAGSIRAMLSLARSEQPIPIAVETIDADPWLLNCENGTIDLTTGQLREHRREDFCTKRCPVEYPTEPGGDPAIWLDFLDRIFASNEQLIGFVRRLMGSSLVGQVRDHVLPILWGTGQNGKSTLVEAWCGLLGEDYAMKAPAGFLMQRRGEDHPTALADLHGKRLVSAIETAESGRLSESLVKELTGGDTIRARRMREDFWQFKPSHTVVLATNHKPTIRGTDYGIWRRLRLVPFVVTIPDEEKDAELPDKLKNEWPLILRWAVGGCLEWQKNGLQEPEEVLIATEDYRSKSDVFGAFLEECCLVGASYKIKSSSLYSIYRKWTEASGEYSETQTKFGERLSERGFSRLRSNGYWYLGITNREIDSHEGSSGQGTEPMSETF